MVMGLGVGELAGSSRRSREDVRSAPKCLGSVSVPFTMMVVVTPLLSGLFDTLNYFQWLTDLLLSTRLLFKIME